jgi:hypothetical protein
VRCRLLVAVALLLVAVVVRAQSWVAESGKPGDFPLSAPGLPVTLVHDAGDATVVAIATRDLAADLERVTGQKPVVRNGGDGVRGPVVFIGTLGRNAEIDRLVATGKLDAAPLRGAWESFIIATVDHPFPNLAQALVIVGSDRRGTAFGVYELSQAIGVSPWHWWADVAPVKRGTLYVSAGARRFGPPSVKYRGIFLNDEDWGLQPWAARTFEPEHGGIGPKTYARVCEMLLRLKANTLWPAMHACTKPFNAFAENKQVADDHAIVMGSSHAEPMLRNNVSEWTAPPEAYNYVTNRSGVLDYWEQRVAANGRFENIYTLGMRGIHDSAMQGPKTDAERIRTLEQIFADQRALLARHVDPRVEQVPQMFCAYKEVLALYRQGLRVPDDVTIVWPDDNFGYVRNFASAGERQRAGGFGVYYHLSYLGAPLSYLWLCTTPPALIWEEMTRAHEHGADPIWIANVGDLKPAEIGTEFFLQLAWDVKRRGPNVQKEFLTRWAAREFGAEHAPEIATILDGYYGLNFQRKPEHLQWWLPKEPPRPSPLTDGEIATRLASFLALRKRVEDLGSRLPAEKRDAFFELVAYPVIGSALANARYFHGEHGETDAATAADAELQQLNQVFNEKLAGGKWRGVMSLEPADDQWKSMRIARWTPPQVTRPLTLDPFVVIDGSFCLQAGAFAANLAGQNRGQWTIVPGLGRTGMALTVLPSDVPPVHNPADAPRLEFRIAFPREGNVTIKFLLLPTHPLSGNELRLAVGLDDAPPEIASVAVNDGGPEWAQGVLNAVRVASVQLRLSAPGTHVLRVYGIDAGVALDRVVVDYGGLASSYLGSPQ